MPARPFSTASDVTILIFTSEEADELQSEVTKGDFAKPDISQLRIFVYDKRTGANATRLDRSGDSTGRSSDFYDLIKRALLMACGVYLSDKGSETLNKMAETWFKANNKNATRKAKDAVKAWQKELTSGNLPPVIVSWQETGDGRCISARMPPASLKGNTEKSLDSMTIMLNGPKCWLAYWESPKWSGKKYQVESSVRFFWLFTTIVHELGHAFEFFLAWFYAESEKVADKPVLEDFKPIPSDKEPEIGFWMEVQLLGGILSNVPDGTDRNNRLRAGVPALCYDDKKERTEKFKHLQELEKKVKMPTSFDDSAFPKSFEVGNEKELVAYVGSSSDWWKEIKTAPLTGYNTDKTNDTDPGEKVPKEIIESIKKYQKKEGYFLSRKGHLDVSSAGTARPHLYQENGHHYISHRPGHKELWRAKPTVKERWMIKRAAAKAAETVETDEGEQVGDNEGEDEAEESEGEAAEESEVEEQEPEEEEESEPEPPKKPVKKPKATPTKQSPTKPTKKTPAK